MTSEIENSYFKAGFNLKIVAPTPSRGLDKETIKKFKNKFYEISKDGKKEIYRVKVYKEPKNLILRMIRYFTIMRKQYKLAKKFKDIDLIVFSSTPPLQGRLIKKLKKKLNAPAIYNLQDIFPDSLVALKNINEKNFIIRYLRKKENDLYDTVDAINTISYDMKKTIIDRVEDPDKINVVYNWVDTKKIRPISKKENTLYDKYGLDKNKFYVSYGGNIGNFQNWEFVLEVIKEVSDKNINFVFFGEGSYLNNLKRSVKENNLSNVFLFPMQHQSLVSEVYSFGDIQLVPLIDKMTNYAFPSKISQILSTGSPILGLFDSNSELSTRINDNNLGFVPKKMEVKEVAAFLVKYKTSKLYLFDKENIRLYAEKNFSKKQQLEKNISIMEKVIKGG